MSGFFRASDGRCFEFNLQTAYTNLIWTLANSSGNPMISWGAFHVVICGICALLVYPDMKFGRIYLGAVSNRPIVIYKRFLFHLAFIAPLLTILLWMKPVTAHLLRALVALNFHPVVSKQPTLLVITTMAVDLFGGQLNTLRLLSCLGVVLSRVVITR
ncbi:hypothetical protein AHF37_04824 [Paragonimus kellicotti]|nr:hypothetical protein AHF37_04824 [Paragonimus kellicotti]